MYRCGSLAMTVMLVVLAAPAAWPADIYRWVDDEGVVHYSQTPPGDRDAQRVDSARPPADDPEQRRQEVEDLMESNRFSVYKQRLEREEAETERQQRKYLAEYCQALREKRRILATEPQVREKTDDGYRMMSSEDRRQRLAEFDQRIESRCQGNPATN